MEELLREIVTVMQRLQGAVDELTRATQALTQEHQREEDVERKLVEQPAAQAVEAPVAVARPIIQDFNQQPFAAQPVQPAPGVPPTIALPTAVFASAFDLGGEQLPLNVAGGNRGVQHRPEIVPGPPVEMPEELLKRPEVAAHKAPEPELPPIQTKPTAEFADFIPFGPGVPEREIAEAAFGQHEYAAGSVSRNYVQTTVEGMRRLNDWQQQITQVALIHAAKLSSLTYQLRALRIP